MHKIRYDVRVAKDLDKIPRVWQKRIMVTLDSKVRTDPTGFGKPLRHILKNYYSLRVDGYRVVYFLEDEVVHIVIIRHRKDVYDEATKRLSQ